MIDNIENKKQQAQTWFRTLRDRICDNFETLDREFIARNPDFPKITTPLLKRKTWQRETNIKDDKDGGGGEISLIYSHIFEKAAINISTVYGKFTKDFQKEIPGAIENGGHFWASGISVITHPRNPYVPPIHMNTRMIVTSKYWLGGGIDLNPIFPNSQDTKKFHAILKDCCQRYHRDYYPEFSAKAEQYFYILHRKQSRGIGGIFYDNLNTKNWKQDFAFTQDVGETFLQIYPDLVRTHYNDAYGEAESATQLIHRGYYTEFNLVYDRGTRFGLMTGGNVEAILASLPPMVAWP